MTHFEYQLALAKIAFNAMVNVKAELACDRSMAYA